MGSEGLEMHIAKWVGGTGVPEEKEKQARDTLRPSPWSPCIQEVQGDRRTQADLGFKQLPNPMAAAWSRFLLPLELSIPHGAGSPAPRIIRGELLAVQPQVCKRDALHHHGRPGLGGPAATGYSEEGKLPSRAPEALDIRRPVVGRGDKPPQNRTLVHRVDLKCGRRRVAHFPAARHGQSEPDFGFVRIGVDTGTKAPSP
uniref:Uncharacterized protein n=1 Tax=Sphaerodactylus townsendi TaxID=933632 RepID=A0ACB8FZH7_9SAUR